MNVAAVDIAKRINAAGAGMSAAVSDPARCGGWTEHSQRPVMLDLHDGTGWCAVPLAVARLVMNSMEADE